MRTGNVCTLSIASKKTEYALLTSVNEFYGFELLRNNVKYFAKRCALGCRNLTDQTNISIYKNWMS